MTTATSTTTATTGSSHTRRPAQAVLIFVVTIASVVGLSVNATSALIPFGPHAGLTPRRSRLATDGGPAPASAD